MKLRRLFNNSMMFRITAKVLLILVPIFIIGSFFVYQTITEQLTNDVKSNLRQELKLKANNISKVIKNQQSKVELMLDHQGVKSMEPQEIEPYFNKIIERNQQVWSHFLITDQEGTEIVHSEGEEHYGKSIADKEYFKVPYNTGEPVIAEPTFSTSTGRKILGVGYPLKVEGEKKGVLAGFVRLSYLTKILNDENKLSQNSYSFILNSNGRLAAHPNQEKVLSRNWLNPEEDEKADTKLSQQEINNMSSGFRDVITNMTNAKQGFKITEVNGERSVVAYQPLGINDMSIATVVPTDDAFKVLIKITNFLKLGTIVLALIIIGVFYYILRSIINSIKKASEFSQEIAAGQLDIENMDSKYDDELGNLVTSLNEMKFNLRNNIRELVNNAAEVVENLTAYSEELSASAQEGNATIDTTNDLVEDISASIQQISASAEEVSSFAQESNSKTEIGSQNINQTLSSINQINQSTDQALNVINDLDETTKEIEGIVELITNISEQTNLLALNAAIEAARASSTTEGSGTRRGEAGQGFAVVAEETNQATDKVRNLINKTQQKADNGLNMIEEVSEQATESKEIKNASQQTANQIEQTANATQNLAEKSEEVKTSTNDIKNMSGQLLHPNQTKNLDGAC